MIDLKDFEYDELIEYLTSVGEKKFRAEQIFSWLHKGVESYDEMTNLSKATREKLEKETYVSTLKIREKYVSKIDGAVKYLFELPDGNCIESVVMRYHHGLTICISSQVGCRMGCRFCASTIGGLYRRLYDNNVGRCVEFGRGNQNCQCIQILYYCIGNWTSRYFICIYAKIF